MVRSLWWRVYDAGKKFLINAGSIILAMSIIMWFLASYPKSDKILESSPKEQVAQSYAGKIGKLMEPVIEPLGFDWKMGVSLITGIAAKEIVISTMAVIYHSDEDTEDSKQLITQIREETHPDGRPVFNKVTAFGFMVFILIYFPCVAVVAAIRKESGSWKWALFTIFYTTGLAWVLAFAVNQVGHLLL